MLRSKTPFIPAIASLALCGGQALAQETASVPELVDALQSGGHVLYLRHAMTETDYADQVAAKLGDCATQRVLSEVGWQQAKAIGSAISGLEIPVGEVISSEYCRAWQTADLAFGDYRQDAALNFAPAEDYKQSDLDMMSANVTAAISQIPQDGNLVIVGHDDPFEAATGIYPEPQGVAYVIAPTGDGFTVLGRIGPDDWPAS
ncbi:Broad specificity phosphatase PhoE [Loktanella sp. DSM 29012]|uniref:histidine phosphatase family protein n=1 Tax=Loktanella sp. DSM 29012 TaxID=1881056 RepID=UPI0008B222C7|nr:histidine phosphatase family protein [Loktanella sp. DSM 29012]SEQ02477.1 Broad specificity phosphatase PhoE [Loktanella sp. DSM 29012]